MTMNSNLTDVQKQELDFLLNDRQKSHGDFEDHARIAQRLKNIFYSELQEREAREQLSLAHRQIEAIDMIFHKIGRIIAGDPNFEDHWTDIAGYAQLAKIQKEG